MSRLGIAVWVVLFLWSGSSFAQPSSDNTTFEAATIKLHRHGAPMSGDLRLGGQFHLAGLPLRLLIASAWQVNPYAVIGGPSWVDSDFYDIAAKAPPKSSYDEIRLMLQGLLIERFRLTVHNGEKVMRVYALTVAKGGPKLKGTETPESETSGCSGNRQLGLAHRSCKTTSMALFAESLPKMSPHYIETPVVNMTDLAGRFDFELSWQPQQLQGRDTGGPGPTIFEALQTQLGLKLESRKLPIPTVVIDKIDRLQAEN